MTTLVDDEQRQRIRRATTRPPFVEAGAGTGKTTELVARIVGLIVGGHATIDQIVAITFTEAAAAELRDRVRSALERGRRPSDVDVARSPAIERALAGLDEAPILTIHAFCQRLLHQHGAEIGLPPVLEVRDRVQARLAFDIRWRRFVRSTLASAEPLTPEREALLRTAFALGMNARHLRTLAERFRDRWQNLGIVDSPGVASVSPAPAMPALISLIACLDRALDGAGHCADPTDRMACKLREVVEPYRNRLAAAATSENVFVSLAALEEAPTLMSTRIGNKNSWPGSALAGVRAALGEAADERELVLEKPRQWALQGLAGLVADFVREGVTERMQQGTLEFHDLLVLARDLLRDRPAVRSALQERFRHVLVDEFQDTDPLQAEIVQFLTVDNRGRATPGGLFTVGDPKQSIYRFRQADLGQFVAMRKARSADVIELSTNFRTVPAVLGWINATFAELLAGSGLGWSPLTAGRGAESSDADGPGLLGSVRLLGGPTARTVKAVALRRLEADAVAEVIAQARDQRWLVGESPARPVRFADIAVLLPTRVALPGLERAMQAADIPYRVESRSLVWSTQEVRDVMAVLRAIDDPTDEIALVAALRTAALGCSDVDLVTWRQAGGRWSHRVPAPDGTGQHPVAQAFEVLGSLHEQRHWMTVPDLLRHVIEDRRMFELAFGRPRQRESWHRLRFVLDRARKWTDDGGSALHAFLAHAEAQVREGADALESVVPEADDDAVRVMTIHAAKGLEFPMVVVAGLGATSSRSDSARVLWATDGTPEVRLGPKTKAWQTPGFAELDESEDRLEREEQDRLAYVAATRARDHLVVSLFHQEVSRAGVSRSIAGRVSRVAARQTTPMSSPIGSGREATAVVSPAEPRSPSAAGYGALTRAALIRQAGRIEAMSATGIRDLVSTHDVIVGIPPDERDERRRFGTVVHEVLERVDLVAGTDVDTLASIVAVRHGLPHRRADVAHSVRLALASSPVTEAVRTGRWWREVPVVAEVDGLVVEGVVDLVYERNGELVVIDHKTDASTTPGLLDHYQWQLLSYAAALGRSTGRSIAEAALLLLDPGLPAAEVLRVPDLDVQLKEWEERLATNTARARPSEVI